MTYGPTPGSYHGLPGPARFVRDVAASLQDGKSVVVVFPDSLVESGIADAMLDDLTTEGVRAVFCEQSSDTFPTRVISTFGSDPVNERVFDEWDTIVGWKAWHGSWVFVAGWQHEDLAEIVARWPAQLKVCGLSAEDRPKLVIAARLADLERTTIAHLDEGDFAVHWWWGVLDRLDTETLLSGISARRFNPVDAAVIAEVAGWDLQCVEFLAAEWDRTTTGLPDAVRQYRAEIAGREPIQLPKGKKRRLQVPPADLEQLWRDGLIDRWGYSIRQAPHTLDDSAVAQRLWMAHNRILIPHVDEERADYERLILARASMASLEGLRRRDDDDVIEIGSLAWLVDTGRVDIGRQARLRLRAFRQLRNDLAHCRPIADELLGQISAYLQF